MRPNTTHAAALLMALAAIGMDPIIPQRTEREADKRTPDDDAERMAAAEAKRQRKAAKRAALSRATGEGGGHD